MYTEALQILQKYHRELTEKAAEDVLEHGDGFVVGSFAPVDEIFDRYSHKLSGIQTLIRSLEHYAPQKRVRHRYRLVTIVDEGQGLEQAANAWLDAHPNVAVQSMRFSPQQGDAPIQLILLTVTRIELNGGEAGT